MFDILKEKSREVEEAREKLVEQQRRLEYARHDLADRRRELAEEQRRAKRLLGVGVMPNQIMSSWSKRERHRAKTTGVALFIVLCLASLIIIPAMLGPTIYTVIGFLLALFGCATGGPALFDLVLTYPDKEE